MKLDGLMDDLNTNLGMNWWQELPVVLPQEKMKDPSWRDDKTQDEFGRSSAIGKLIRSAWEPHLKFVHDSVMPARLNGRIGQPCWRICNRPSGQRIITTENKDNLVGFKWRQIAISEMIWAVIMSAVMMKRETADTKNTFYRTSSRPGQHSTIRAKANEQTKKFFQVVMAAFSLEQQSNNHDSCHTCSASYPCTAAWRNRRFYLLGEIVNLKWFHPGWHRGKIWNDG